MRTDSVSSTSIRLGSMFAKAESSRSVKVRRPASMVSGSVGELRHPLVGRQQPVRPEISTSQARSGRTVEEPFGIGDAIRP
jgi:hypothetical protein